MRFVYWDVREFQRGATLSWHPPMGNAIQVQRTIYIREIVTIQQQAIQITNKMRLSELCSVRKV